MSEIWAGMATLLERESSRYAIESLLPQIDRLTVTPGDKIGDQAKFASCVDAPGVFFAVDDDLIYPPDFVEVTLEALGRHPGCVVGYGGWIIDREGERTQTFRSLATVEGEHVVHAIHTCSCAFHVDTIRPLMSDFPMIQADIWFALKAARMGVPLVVLPHEEGWFGYIPPPRTIWDETKAKTGSSLDASEATRLGVAMLSEHFHAVPA